jgi:hypothetical protein
MNISYTWKITGLRAKDISDDRKNTVVQTYWEKTGTDDQGNTGTFLGATPLEVDPEADSHVPFDELTEEIVIGWIQEHIQVSAEYHINDEIQKQISEKRESVSDVMLSWKVISTPK